MNPKLWQEIEQVYHAALELEPERRAEYLVAACHGDEELRREVESLLRQDASAPNLLLNWRGGAAAGTPAGIGGLTPGMRLGPYQVEERLGAGGMGEVWKASDTRLHRAVAMKVVRSEQIGIDRRADERLWLEARAAAQVSHPNLCQLFDVVDDGCHVVLVMELLEGKPLSARISEGPAPPCEAKAILDAVLVALTALHEHHLVHRDLKPSNVFLTPSGVKVLDFGLAARHKLDDKTRKLLDATLTETFETPDLLAGTPAYMAPERIDGAPPAPTADVFAAGCLLYEVLTGKQAFQGDTLSEVLQNIIRGGPAATDLPPESRRYWPVIERALTKKPEDRFASAAEMREAMDNHAIQPAGVTPKRFGVVARRTALFAAIVLAVSGVWIASRSAIFGSMFGRKAEVANNAGTRSIAVLPIANRTGDASLDYIVEGTTSNIIRQLSAVPGLRVISKNSVQRFAAAADPRKAASELGVAHVLAGSIYRDGKNSFRMEFELSRGADGVVLLSRQYLPDGPDLLATQATVVVDIVQSMAMTLTRAEQKKLGERPTMNNAAWDNYLRGEQLEDLMDPVSLNASLPFFQKAIDKDPAFALALSELGSAHLKLGIFFDDPRRHMPVAKQLVVRALSIDDSLPSAHAVLGLIALLYDWDYATAERQLLLGSGRMNPAALHSLSCSSHLLESTGRGQRADEELHAALLTDPLSATIQSELGCNAYYSRQYEQAIREYQKALLLRPNDLNSLWGLGRCYAQRKMFADAETSLKAARMPDGGFPPMILGDLGYVYGSAGRNAEAQDILRQLEALRSKVFVDPFLEAIVYLSMGQMNETFAHLNDAYEVRSAFLISLKSDPKWDRVRSDPRMHAMLQKVGFSNQ